MLGGDKLAAELRKLGDDIGGELEAAVAAGGHVIRDEASRRAPKKTGTLARSITVKTTRSR
jgi:hypothetical protein